MGEEGVLASELLGTQQPGQLAESGIIYKQNLLLLHTLRNSCPSPPTISRAPLRSTFGRAKEACEAVC